MADFIVGLGMMSLQASLIIMVVFVVRQFFFLTGMPKKYSMMLWFLVFFFLVFPWKITLPVGFWHDAPGITNHDSAVSEDGIKHKDVTGNIDDAKDTENTGSTEGAENGADAGITANTENGANAENTANTENAGSAGDAANTGNVANAGNAVNEKNMENADNTENATNVKDAEKAGSTENTGHAGDSRVFSLLFILWIFGVAVLLLCSGISYNRLRKDTLCSLQENENIYYGDDIAVPMVLGIFRPRIYIPSAIDVQFLPYVIAHEKTHIQRKDAVTKLLAYGISCVHWFNPFVWFAYHYMAKDMEMTCDEETIRRIGNDKKNLYAKALLQMSATNSKSIFALPPAFGESNTGHRIKNVLRHKSAAKILTLTGILLVCVLAVAFISKREDASPSPKADEKKPVQTVTEREPDKDRTKEEEETLSKTYQVTVGSESGEESRPGGGGEQGKASATIKEEEELDFKTVRKAFQKKEIGKLDFKKYSNGEKNLLGDDALNYNIDFYFHYKEEQYRLSVSYMKKTDKLQDISITRVSDSDYACLYTTVFKRFTAREKEKYPHGKNGLEKFIKQKPKIEDWLSIKLPEGYTLDSYLGGIGYAGGALIAPQIYDIEGGKEDSFAPAEWMYAGMIGRIPDAGNQFSFKNGKLQKDVFPHENHSSIDKVERLDDLDWPAILLNHYNHDLYTGGQLAELMEKGIEPEITTSDYWHFFFVKEGEDVAYYLALASKEFTRKEAIAIAKTVKFK